MDKLIQYLSFSCPSFPRGYDFGFLQKFNKFILGINFFEQTGYSGFTIIFTPDGVLPGSGELTFSKAPDFRHQGSKGTLILSVKVLESEWTGLVARDLERVFELKTVEALLHVCKLYSLDSAGLEEALVQSEVITDFELVELKSKISSLTSTRRAKRPSSKAYPPQTPIDSNWSTPTS